MRTGSAESLVILGLVVLSLLGPCYGEQPNVRPLLLKDRYPILTTGPLMEARLAQLPAGTLLQARGIKITAKDLDAEIAKAPESVRAQLIKNSFFVLENRATRDLLRAEAKEWAKSQNRRVPSDTDELTKLYLESVTAGIRVSDSELKEFYESNKDMTGGAGFEQVKEVLKEYVLEEKTAHAVDAHVAAIGKRIPISIDRTWVGKQYPLATDNPVDKARLSGKATMVEFGADGCVPCDMMAPILESLKKEYKGKLNVLFVHIRKEQVLAARYGIRSIPVQAFFDKQGKERFRHTGFFPKEQVVSKLTEMGVN